jgi:hypothetical protein
LFSSNLIICNYSLLHESNRLQLQPFASKRAPPWLPPWRSISFLLCQYHGSIVSRFSVPFCPPTTRLSPRRRWRNHRLSTKDIDIAQFLRSELLKTIPASRRLTYLHQEDTCKDGFGFLKLWMSDISPSNVFHKLQCILKFSTFQLLGLLTANLFSPRPGDSSLPCKLFPPSPSCLCRSSLPLKNLVVMTGF